MEFYLAPLEGVTYTVVRNAFLHHFPGFSKYFTPFIPTGKRFSTKIKRDLDPANNEGLYLVPQAITRDHEELLILENQLMDLGYTEYNLNMGCPSGTVVSKGRGAGCLKDPMELDRLLDGIFSGTRMKVSVKTRIGLESVDEWEDILRVYEKYPLEELIIHPRLRTEMYRGTPHYECYGQALGRGLSLCYNGDIWDLDSFRYICDSFPDTDRVMLGRGAMARPWILEELSLGEAIEVPVDRLRGFLEEIYEGYRAVFSGEKDVIMHMKEIWSYMRLSFPKRERDIKKLLKSRDAGEFKRLSLDIINS